MSNIVNMKLLVQHTKLSLQDIARRLGDDPDSLAKHLRNITGFDFDQHRRKKLPLISYNGRIKRIKTHVITPGAINLYRHRLPIFPTDLISGIIIHEIAAGYPDMVWLRQCNVVFEKKQRSHKLIAQVKPEVTAGDPYVFDFEFNPHSGDLTSTVQRGGQKSTPHKQVTVGLEIEIKNGFIIT